MRGVPLPDQLGRRSVWNLLHTCPSVFPGMRDICIHSVHKRDSYNTFSSKTGVLMETAPWRLKHRVMTVKTSSRMAIWKGS